MGGGDIWYKIGKQTDGFKTRERVGTYRGVNEEGE